LSEPRLDLAASERRWDQQAYESARSLELRYKIADEKDVRVCDRIYVEVDRPAWRHARQDLLTRILANLRLADEYNLPVRYSRRATDYTFERYGYWEVITLIDRLVELELVEQAAGHYHRDWANGAQTGMWATSRLMELYYKINPERIILEPPELIQIRERQDYDDKHTGRRPKLYPLPATTAVSRMRDQLTRYNNYIVHVAVEIKTHQEELSSEALDKLQQFVATYRYDRIRLYEWAIKRTGCSPSPTRVAGRSFPEDYTDSHLERRTMPVIHSPYRTPTTQSASVPGGGSLLLGGGGNSPSGVGAPMPEARGKYGNTNTGKIGMMIKYNQLHRVFTEDLGKGGRFYGPSVQGLCKELRSHLYLNGLPTRELDYSGLHLRMLYHLEGLHYEEDPYGYSDSDERPYAKLIALVAINKQSGRGMINAMRKAFAEHGLDRAPDHEIDRMITQFERAHARIKKHFCSDVGLRLQNLDSQITSLVLAWGLDRDIPVLPVHDSYIVPAQYEQELYETMVQAYRKLMGFNPVIK
jgi:hypothetical protein